MKNKSKTEQKQYHDIIHIDDIMMYYTTKLEIDFSAKLEEAKRTTKKKKKKKTTSKMRITQNTNWNLMTKSHKVKSCYALRVGIAFYREENT